VRIHYKGWLSLVTCYRHKKQRQGDASMLPWGPPSLRQVRFRPLPLASSIAPSRWKVKVCF